MIAVALDDEPPALKVLTAFCSKVDFIELQKTFTNTEDALHYISHNDVDLIFIDINMPAISGIDFYRKLPKKPMLIFTTAYSEFALEGFNLNALDYLLKPFTFSRFYQAVEKANAAYKKAAPAKDEQYLILRINYSLTKIDLSHIIYIEGLDDYLKIHLVKQKPVVVRLTMKTMMEKLPADQFTRVHRSYIVAINKVESIRNKIITICGEEVPVSNSYEANFLQLFKG